MVTILDSSAVTCTQEDIECPIEVGGKILKDNLMVVHLMKFDLMVNTRQCQAIQVYGFYTFLFE